MAEQTPAHSLSQWRAQLLTRCAALGWDVPNIFSMGGYLLNRLTRYVTEAESLAGIVHIERDEDPHLQTAGVALGYFTGKPLAEIKQLAEGLPAESAFDEHETAASREQWQREAALRRQRDQLAIAEKEQHYIDQADLGSYRR